MKNANEKIRVLHLIWRFEKGGIEQFLFDFMKNVDITKFHFDFAVCGDVTAWESDERLSDSAIYHLPIINGRTGKMQYLRELEKILKTEKYDVVHSHLAFMNISTLRLAKKHGIKRRVSHVHVAAMGKKWSIKNSIKRFLINHYATACIACSTNTSDFYYGSSKKAEVLNSGVNIDRFSKNFNENRSGNGVIILRRFCTKNSPYFTVGIVKHLHTLKPDLIFTWCGDGEMQDEIISYCEKEKIDINFVGSVDNPEDYLKKASYMLMPSHSEGFGMVAIEAQLSNVFVFASDRVPKDTDLGLIEYYPLDTEDAWSKRISDFIDEKRFENYSIDVHKVDKVNIVNISKRIVEMYNQ